MLYQYAGNKKKKILPKWHRWKQEADFVGKRNLILTFEIFGKSVLMANSNVYTCILICHVYILMNLLIIIVRAPRVTCYLQYFSNTIQHWRYQSGTPEAAILSLPPTLVLKAVCALFMKFIFIYVYRYPTWFPYQIMFVSISSNTMGVRKLAPSCRKSRTNFIS
jgi:hypothetical protein